MYTTNLIFLISCILAEIDPQTHVGFYNVGDGVQNMTIETENSFHSIEKAFLMEKTNTKDETDYVDTEDILKYTRTIRDPKEYKEYKRKHDRIKPEDYQYHEIKSKQFNTIFVDMKPVKENPEVTYAIKLKMDNGLEVITRAFHYSEKMKRWEMGVAEGGKKRHKMWIWVGLCILGVLVVGVVVSFLI